MTTVPSDLISIAKGFKNTPQEIKLAQWLQASTGPDKQAQFAMMWRDGENKGAIDFAKVFQFYQGSPHQNAALKWLKQNSQPKTIDGFFKMWAVLPPWSGNPIQLSVPYYEQTDNAYEAMRTCNTSSCAMVAKFLKAKISGDDAYYQIVRKYGDTTDHGAQTKALAEIKIQSTWHVDLGFEDLDKSLAAGLPIVIGILHRGSLQSPTGGHMIVVIGKTIKGDYVCHDPFGSLMDKDGGYTGDVENGKAAIYPRFILNRRWLPDSDHSGWGRLFYNNKH